ncbi:unnamed protein product [Moneuplotes crassus]|uniref:Uncharacterized protein n=1 Tax=Euplotes crassus TaxID=5936 RepID=A0AAD1XR19_EUPCR|nr:unnamed protein product [Moneuplotes crassus]
MDGPIQTMAPNIIRINNPYIDSNPENPQPHLFMSQPHQVIPTPSAPTDLNIGIQIGVQPAPNRANLNISKSQKHYNPSAPAKYMPRGPAATGNGEIEIGQLV